MARPGPARGLGTAERGRHPVWAGVYLLKVMQARVSPLRVGKLYIRVWLITSRFCEKPDGLGLSSLRLVKLEANNLSEFFTHSHVRGPPHEFNRLESRDYFVRACFLHQAESRAKCRRG
jgi:hypothetical protein